MKKTIAVLSGLLLAGGVVHAQQVTIYAEPLAGSVQLLTSEAGVAVGALVTGGPQFGIRINEPDDDTVRSWATAYPVLSLSGARARLLFSPLGVALAKGNDFTAIYPSAQTVVELRNGRAAAGTGLRIIRVAGPNGSADWWTEWLLLRVGFSL